MIMGCGASLRVMVGLILFTLLAFAAQQGNGIRVHGSISNDTIQSLFERWAQKHNRVYHSSNEKLDRFMIFRENLQYIKNHNAKQSVSYSMGLNQFSDLTNAEFRNKYFGRSSRKPHESTSQLVANEDDQWEWMYSDVLALPTVDWRAVGAVSGVKNQQGCGACWAFSAIGAVEALRWFWTGEMLTLSEQELIDCDSPPNGGCDGGHMTDAFRYVATNGIHTAASYPYTASRGTSCQAKMANSGEVLIDSFVQVPSGSEEALLKAVTRAPVSVQFTGTDPDFQHYRGGVFTGTCDPTLLNHAGLAVGHGTDENGMDYWIVKNSWDQGWGEGGFIRMQRLGSCNTAGFAASTCIPRSPSKLGPSKVKQEDHGP